MSLFPIQTPYNSFYIDVSFGHTLYVEECGNPNGIPVVFLHGGPGHGCVPEHRQFFDPAYYRLILFDQRGCGRSKPLGKIEHNTTKDLVEDINAIREHLHIDKWHVFGGSWGAGLAVAYGEAYAKNCLSLILRGVFLGSSEEIDWFMKGLQSFYPELKDFLEAPVPLDKRHDVLGYYTSILCGPKTEEAYALGRRYIDYESQCVKLTGGIKDTLRSNEDLWAYGRIMAHYMSQGCFMEDKQLINNISLLKDIPLFIAQGRYDVICPPKYAYAIYKKLPHAKLFMIQDAGHSVFEPGIAKTLVDIMEQLKNPAF
jgi:proline iminopeptidase